MSRTQHNTTAVERCITRHIERYGLSTVRVIRQLPELQSLGKQRLAQTLQRLKRDGCIAEAPLYLRRNYIHSAAAGPLREGAKIRHYAMLCFCCLADHSRQRLTSEEMQSDFPDLYRSDSPMTYYVDVASDVPVLGFVRVDTGGQGRWDRIVARALNDVRTHESRPGFQPYIRAGQFRVSILTAMRQKAERIADALSSSRDDRARHVAVSAIPELLHLIAPPPDW